ncbi:MAG: YihY/virulence factor BrkB family protein [bacterium]
MQRERRSDGDAAGRRTLRRGLRNLWRKFMGLDTLGLAAELGFWYFYSIFPFLIFFIALTSFLPVADDPEKVLGLMQDALPPSVYQVVGPTLHDTLIRPKSWLAVGTLILALWAASTAVSSLVSTLNRVYRVPETRPYWKRKGVALLLTGSLIIGCLVAFLFLVLAPVLTRYLAGRAHLEVDLHPFLQVLRPGVGVLVLVVSFAIIYRYAPDTRLTWRSVLPGSIVAMIGSFGVSRAFAYYLQNFAYYNRLYGTLGAVIAMMTWFYLVGLMVLLGGLVNSEFGRPGPGARSRGE